MCHSKLLIALALVIPWSVVLAQEPEAPSASTTPFIADTTGADRGVGSTPVPDTSFPAKPLAAPLKKTSRPSEAGVARAEPVTEREVITRLQIFLDQRSFGPGKIDGRWGEFTAKALIRYQQAKGLPVTGQIDTAMQQELDQIFPIYTTYQLSEEDFKRIGDIPYKPSEQAKVKAMLYRSMAEFVAERYHCENEFLAKLNADRNLTLLRPGDTLRVPNVPPFQIELIKETGKLPPNPALANRKVKIDTRYRMLDILEGDTLISSFPITPGSERLPAPPGVWKIVGVATMPWFRWDDSMLNKGVRSENFFNIPPGPNSPVGIVWIGLNKSGIGIHGTNMPDTIGRSASHGCIRLANWDAARVINEVTSGVTVEIY
jgi:lipoprotein-anchoring transpeptidase ErfK/SrfK